MTTDLTTQSPSEIDTALAAIYTRLYAKWDEIDRVSKYIEDMEKGLAKRAESPRYDAMYFSYTQEALDGLLAKRNDLRQHAKDIKAETEPYEDEYRSRPWSRFFLVQNNGGHIHSSMHCSTCYPTTRFGWLPEFSGQTEAEAVAKHGAILCTVCYPSAPTEWTDRHDDSVCSGSGAYFNSDLPHRGPHFYSGNWATCEGCGERVTMVKSGKIRKHKKA
jgi:hypothetical protein